MYSNSIIQVNELSKSFLIRQEQAVESYQTIRDLVSGKAKKWFSLNKNEKNAALPGKESEEFWALKDINFDVMQGNRVGIIGQNGAGKSTLLKIISRITAPTKGNVQVQGRVVSLLEIGTGFHPELSGHENIYLNGVILGMKRAEIKKRFHEIVAFAEIEKFLDMPVKKYSTGMYMRLAFAIAAHLEPEILIIDEMLAVGDAAFQKKCLTRMQEISRSEGRTILFVSHNIDAIRMLCDKAIFLKKGEMITAGNVKPVIDAYVDSYYKKRTSFIPDTQKSIYISSISLSKDEYEYGSDLLIYCSIVSDKGTDFAIGLGLSNYLDARVGSALIFSKTPLAKGENVITIKIPLNTIVPGNYKMQMAIGANTQEIFDAVLDYPSFSVVPDEANRYMFSQWMSTFSDNVLIADLL
jgi:lipopolysaccharide transport system ATP-binding protein